MGRELASRKMLDEEGVSSRKKAKEKGVGYEKKKGGLHRKEQGHRAVTKEKLRK